ncbi:hypothetical protein KCV07_g6775, partial [Aureobasidium melanogenum]
MPACLLLSLSTSSQPLLSSTFNTHSCRADLWQASLKDPKQSSRAWVLSCECGFLQAMSTLSTLLSPMPVGCTSDLTSSSVLATVMDFDQRKLSLLLHQLNAHRSTLSASAGANMVVLWSRFFSSPLLCELLVPSECPSLSQGKHMAQFQGKSDGASLALVSQSAAPLSLVRFDGNSNPIAPIFSLDLSMTSMSLSLRLLVDAMAFGVHDAADMTHDSQPALKSYMEVDDQLRAFSVTQPSLKRIFRSNQPLAILFSYLDSVRRQHVILKLAAFNNSTILHAYLSGTAPHNKKISQFFDLVDAGPAPTFCTLYSLCFGHPSVEPTQSNLSLISPVGSGLSAHLSGPARLDTKSLQTITVLDHIIVSGPWHLNKRCLVLMTTLLKALANVKVYQAAGAWDIDRLMVEAAQRFGEYVSGAFDRDDFPNFVEAVFNSVTGPAELLYDHLVKECSHQFLTEVQFSGHEDL